MQKFIKILAIIAMALVALSLLLILITLPLQRTFGQAMEYSDDIVSLLPIFPLQTFLLGLVNLGLLILLMCMAAKTKSFWAEILVFAMLAVVLPGVSRVTGPMESVMLSSVKGSLYIAARNVSNQLVSYCTIPSSLGCALGYAVCGMSIVYKKMHK